MGTRKLTLPNFHTEFFGQTFAYWVCITGVLFLLGNTNLSKASPYFEFGTSAGTISKGNGYFSTTGMDPSNMGFIGSLNFYFPVTPMKHVAHLEFGMQNRFTLVSGTDSTVTNSQHAILAPAASMRIEFWRLYVGGGFAPMNFKSKNGGGFGSLTPGTGTSSYFGEVGIIWRVIPEFQICLTLAQEYASSTGASGLSATEYGVRFRFPISPKEIETSGGVKWDGFRYPFGFMK